MAVVSTNARKKPRKERPAESNFSPVPSTVWILTTGFKQFVLLIRTSPFESRTQSSNKHSRLRYFYPFKMCRFIPHKGVLFRAPMGEANLELMLTVWADFT